MKELVFALEFRGSAAPVPGSDKKMKAKTSATSQTLCSLLKADGIQAAVESAGAGSELRVRGRNRWRGIDRRVRPHQIRRCGLGFVHDCRPWHPRPESGRWTSEGRDRVGGDRRR